MRENQYAIRVQDLGKRYDLGETVDLARNFRETLASMPRWLGGKAKRAVRESIGATATATTGAGRPANDTSVRVVMDEHSRRDSIWALRNLTFDVQPGETVGIIGRNGSGKSTLLKILSRVTWPTEGSAEIHGRVGSLLEVGTGFHPELTGRDNIYLNGAILGMRKAEIDRKFDEIVEFAGVAKFLDTPVKRFSSGMRVRLAFAVSAHLEPEILIIDEVLAVGDQEFQRKCLGKMQDVSRGGRTVLFVSHNLAAVRQLCATCVWLDEGQKRRIGPSADVISEYLLESDKSQGMCECAFREDSSKEFQLLRARLLSQTGETTRYFDCDGPVKLELACQVREAVRGLYGYLAISRLDGTTVMVGDSLDVPPNPLDNLPVGKHNLRIVIPARTLGPGDYAVYVNFTSISGKRGFNVDSPGTIATFHLDDHGSRRGNSREGFFSTLLPWQKTDSEA